VGFRVADALLEMWQAGPWRAAFGGKVAEAVVTRSGEMRRVKLLKPESFMNLSGTPARQMADYYRLTSEDVLVVLDDIALPLGKLRARAGGSAGGHKGLAHVGKTFGTDKVARLRVGVGEPPEFLASEDYVLAAFGDDEKDTIASAIRLAAKAAEDWLFDGLSAVMDKYNRPAEADES
jgi:PTH1 family peptidyl-tRNA hydrolase